MRPNLHALLADNLLDPRACGRLRRIPVTIGGTPFHPLAIPQLVAECARDIVIGQMDKKATTAHLRRRASETLPPADQARLVEIVETEVMSLHAGNIARFRLSPPEFEAWKKVRL